MKEAGEPAHIASRDFGNKMMSHIEYNDPYAQRPWLAAYPDAVPTDIGAEDYSTLVDMFETSVATYADRPAMESFGVRQSFHEMGVASRQVAAWLQARGLVKGDRVAIMSPNVLAYPSILFGALFAGGVVVNINPLYTHSELEHQINDAADAEAYLARLAEVHPVVRVVSSEHRLGFAAAVNRGVAAGRGDVVVVCNNDAVPAAGWIEPCSSVRFLSDRWKRSRAISRSACAC